MLERRVSVVRVQTRLQTHNLWASLLSHLLGDYPDYFQLYALKEEKVSQMSSVCVIDPPFAGDLVERLPAIRSGSRLAAHRGFAQMRNPTHGSGWDFNTSRGECRMFIAAIAPENMRGQSTLGPIEFCPAR